MHSPHAFAGTCRHSTSSRPRRAVRRSRRARVRRWLRVPVEASVLATRPWPEICVRGLRPPERDTSGGSAMHDVAGPSPSAIIAAAIREPTGATIDIASVLLAGAKSTPVVGDTGTRTYRPTVRPEEPTGN